MVVRGFLSFLFDILAPPLCLHCGSDILEEPSLAGVSVPHGWSSEIFSFFDQGQRVLCPDCLMRLEPASNPCPLAVGVPARETSRLITPFFTNEILLSVVRFLKFEGGVPASNPLSWWMASAFRRCGDLPEAPKLIVPVPLHGRRRRRRGYNQAALLAVRVSERLDLPYEDRILVRCRHTRSQARLGEAERDRNVLGAFQIKEKDCIRGRHIILVDDLVTSGGTVRSCIESILPASPAGVTVLAAGRRKMISYMQMKDRAVGIGRADGAGGDGTHSDDRSRIGSP